MKVPKFFIGVASKDHVAIGISQGFCQFCHGKSSPVKRLCKGDYIIYYSPKQTMKSTQYLQQFTGIGLITDETPYQVEQSPEFQPFRRNVDYFDSANCVNIRSLIPYLPFIKNKKSWGVVFRYGFVEIDLKSFEIIATAMLGRTGAPTIGL